MYANLFFELTYINKYKMKKSLKLNAFLNIIKQLCSVVFPLITIPYVSRVLGPESYGKYTFSNSIVNYFVLIAGLGIYNYAIREGAIVRDNKEKLSKTVNEIFTINIYSTVVAYLLLWGIVVISPQLQGYRLIIAVESIYIIFTTIGTDWVNAIFEDYFYITIRYICMQLISIICLFIFVKDSSDYIVYAMIVVLASVGGNLFNIMYVHKKYVHIKIVKNCNFKSHIMPIIILFFNTLAVTIYVNSDTTILGIFKSDFDVGVYSVAVKIYLVVKQILNAIVTVSLPRLSKYIGNGHIDMYQSLLNKIRNILLLIIVPCIFGLFMLSPEIIRIISGEEYIKGATALRILSFALIFAVLACYYTTCVLIPNRNERVCLVASIISACLNIGLNFLLIPKFSYNAAAFTTLISEVMVLVICIYFSKKIINSRVPLKIIISTILIGVSVMEICLVCKVLISNIKLVILISVLASICVYFLILYIMKIDEIFDFIRDIKNKN